MRRTGPLVALALATAAVGLAGPAGAAGPVPSPTGENVILDYDRVKDAVIVGTPGKVEAFSVVATRISGTVGEVPATVTTVRTNDPLSLPFSPTYTAGSATIQIVAQGGGPGLDTFYVTFSCTAPGQCSEVPNSRDLTSHTAP